MQQEKILGDVIDVTTGLGALMALIVAMILDEHAAEVQNLGLGVCFAPKIRAR